MENEIMNNDEVMETTEEIVKTASKGFGKATTIGISMIVGGLAYKFIVAPTVGKLKAMKARKGFRVVNDEVVVENVKTVDEDNSEN